jgi:hypothetical protein
MKPIIIFLLVSLTLWGCGGGSNESTSAESSSAEAEGELKEIIASYDRFHDKFHNMSERYYSLDMLVLRPLSKDDWKRYPKFLPESLPHPVTNEPMPLKENPEVKGGGVFIDQRLTEIEGHYFFQNAGVDDQYRVSLMVADNSMSYEKHDFGAGDSVATYKGFKCYFAVKDPPPASSAMEVHLPPFVKIRLDAHSNANYIRKNAAKILDAMKLEELNQAINQNPYHYVKAPKK